MIQSESGNVSCVCPDCGYRCNACLGTATVISREELEKLRNTEWFTPNFNSTTTGEEEDIRE